LMHRALIRALRLEAVDIRTASSGKEAVAIASQEAIDVLVTDYNLLDQTGIEVAQLIRAVHPKVDVVLVSGYFDWETRERELEAAGIEFFVAKPWEPDQLEGVIRLLFKRRRQP
jgi:two-component system, response regulator YesN